MYRIIGADGREYGPVSADQLRKWIAEGRANAHTRVRREGGGEWKTLCELPEFSAAFSGGPPPLTPGVPPDQNALLGAIEADAMAREFIARDYQLNIGHCISRGWNLVMANFWLTVGASFLVNFLAGAVGATGIGALLLNFVLFGGLDWMFLKLVRGQKAELADAFAGFSPAFLPLLLFSLVAQLLTGLGFVFCILPGIYLGIAWLLFTALLILDKRMDFWPAMELSRKVVTHHWWQVFGLFLVCMLVHIAGTLVFCVGIFIARPITTAAMVWAYEDIFGARPIPGGLAPAVPVPASPGPTAPVPGPASAPTATPPPPQTPPTAAA